ncbi:glycosyltransferase family 2 protein [Porphyromonas circumdentaria]|uniref:Glycosyltransferase, GT2 family n=1 Tax=Porphyromonas circumdentaria TaxID=29524 RepID=A0A1T4NM00_9PORP|nr:glycosyltransferase family 2 protein [Porphyromonas circumdentaria]MBB6276123.1 GT2 family glycosyltransferase [Porphyromonas circumdentaria]MDO4722748.1 glycosyltransferase family 2 protein [Porphyromonas circumdentaria]SJZ80279.1 Glycosyltransferase, GT2 family [Porphyromonas circumdentaria]
MAKDLTIVIVNYKVPHFVAQCLDSVAKAITSIDAEVWVVDNASGDGSVDLLRERFPWCNIVANSDNIGFARANNQVLKKTYSEYALLLNPDTLIGESTLKECISFMENHRDAGALGVRMMNAQGSFLPESKRGEVTPFVAFCKITGLGNLFPKSSLFNRYYLGHLSNEVVCEAPILSGAFMFMRREALQEANYLDERYFMYGEDIDLSYSILKRGYKNYYLPIPILHYKGESESASANPDRYLGAFYGAMELFYNKYHKGSWLSRRLMRWAVLLQKKRGKKTLIKRKKENLTPIIATHLSQEELDSIPAGSFLQIERAFYSYDELLDLIRSLEGRGVTVLIYDENRSVTLGPGGVYS